MARRGSRCHGAERTIEPLVASRKSAAAIPDSRFPIPDSRLMPARLDNLRESTDRSVRLVALGHLADAVAARSGSQARRMTRHSMIFALHYAGFEAGSARFARI